MSCKSSSQIIRFGATVIASAYEIVYHKKGRPSKRDVTHLLGYLVIDCLLIKVCIFLLFPLLILLLILYVCYFDKNHSVSNNLCELKGHQIYKAALVFLCFIWDIYT